MIQNLQTKAISTPSVYHREYENDLPKPNEVTDNTLSQFLRVTQVALPFISLYKPLGQPLSIVLGSTRVISTVAQMIEAISSKDANAIGKKVLEVAIASTALACSILAHPLGMIVTTAHDMVINVSQLIQAFYDQDYKKAAEVGLHLLNNALYLGSFAFGSLQWSIASIGMQVFIGFYHSCDEFKKGNYLEGCGHLLMAGIRGKQMYGQVQALKLQNNLEKMLAAYKTQLLKETSSNATDANDGINQETLHKTKVLAEIKLNESADEIAEYAKEKCINEGTLQKTKEYVYLKLKEDYLVQIFNKIKESNPNVKMPIFHGNIGPHISIIRHDEWKGVPPEQISELGAKFMFNPVKVDVIQTAHKKLWVLTIDPSPELAAFRKLYAVGDLPHGHAFHITLAQQHLSLSGKQVTLAA